MISIFRFATAMLGEVGMKGKYGLDCDIAANTGRYYPRRQLDIWLMISDKSTPMRGSVALGSAWVSNAADVKYRVVQTQAPDQRQTRLRRSHPVPVDCCINRCNVPKPSLDKGANCFAYTAALA
ncbi:hypothetical protein Cob_v011996 [Colletotrichum orbiculare MAFF 240422]|uniref:Uncharacterized protein n=1 Tax=Colletotrichum orbiculare (strain 104-T / ATCC 96160 / CBS 514.97 / LARS 414 / MAFF 240422) TaxID=1213857 RepID=A0A484FB87_COLOR|nr:hypothetical protein Cob_v011996 [Colletotrichum orbiculare MAFF 240422]